jgi:hypothetical protein
MLDQLFNIVKQFGQDSVVNNPEVPNEHNKEVMADATSTITSGFQNILAGGGFQNILDLFKGGGNNNKSSGGGGIGGLLKNPIVSMMIGYFISKLVSKYKMSPAAASGVANKIIPGSISNLIQQTNDPNNEHATMDNLVNSLIGKGGQQQSSANGGSPLQDLLDQFIGDGNSGSPGGGGGGFNIQDIIGNLTQKAQNNLQEKHQGGGDGLMDMIKGFFSN